MSGPKPGRDEVHWIGKGWQNVHIGWCPSEVAWNKAMKRLGVKDAAYPTVAGCCTEFASDRYGVCVIVTLSPTLAKPREPLEIIGLIVHEATHAFQKVCLDMGEDEPSCEFEAYSMQAITQQLIQAVDNTWGGLLADRPAA
ncbi:MAG: hypothetical protein HY859_06935 [Caulobacterales bacterium]|nr:hypothetical protein [Caulobacterales bacterium]